ncbi:MAG: ABC transporter substrate-binding protein, partial [Planctomycetota bacterium]
MPVLSRTICLLVAALLALCVGGRLAAVELETVTIQLKWDHQFQFAGYYAAIDQGYYADEGLAVQLLPRQSDSDPITIVTSGQADYGVADSGLVLRHAQHNDVILVAQIFQHSPHVILTRADSGLSSARDLAGRTIMGLGDQPSHAAINALLNDALGPSADVIRAPIAYDFDAFCAGEVDATTAYLTDQPHHLRQRGIAFNVINPADHGIDVYGDNLFTSRKEFTTNRNRVERMRRATLRGWRYALNHQSEVVELIRNHYRPDLSRDHLLHEAKLTDLMILSEITPLGHVSLSRYRQALIVYQRAGLFGDDTISLLGFSPFTTDSLNNSTTAAAPPPTALKLSPAERTWLDDHPVIRVSNEMDWPPYDFIDNGQPAGFSIDYVKLLAAKLDLEIEWVNGHPWSELLTMARNKQIDVVQSVARSEEREQFLIFCQPYSNNPRALFTRPGDLSISNLDDLSGRTLALVGSFDTSTIIRANYPAINVLEVDSTLAAINAVIYGRADACLDRQSVVDYLIRTNNLSGIAYAAMTGIDSIDQSWLHTAVRDDWPLLASALSKADASLTEAEIQPLIDRWLIRSPTPPAAPIH